MSLVLLSLGVFLGCLGASVGVLVVFVDQWHCVRSQAKAQRLPIKTSLDVRNEIVWEKTPFANFGKGSIEVISTDCCKPLNS